MKWLVEAAVPSDVALPSQTSAPFFYREELSADTAEPSLFVAGKRIRSRMVDASVATAAVLSGPGLLVEQEIALAIAFGTTNQLIVDAPSSVIDSGTLHSRSTARPAAFERIELGEDAALNLGRVNVDLASERTGDVVVRARYELAAGNVNSGGKVEIPAAATDGKRIDNGQRQCLERDGRRITRHHAG